MLNVLIHLRTGNNECNRVKWRKSRCRQVGGTENVAKKFNLSTCLLSTIWHVDQMTRIRLDLDVMVGLGSNNKNCVNWHIIALDSKYTLE